MVYSAWLVIVADLADIAVLVEMEDIAMLVVGVGCGVEELLSILLLLLLLWWIYATLLIITIVYIIGIGIGIGIKLRDITPLNITPLNINTTKITNIIRINSRLYNNINIIILDLLFIRRMVEI